MLRIKYQKNHYIIEIDGVFYCSCDNKREVDEEIKLYEKEKEKCYAEIFN